MSYYFSVAEGEAKSSLWIISFHAPNSFISFHPGREAWLPHLTLVDTEAQED